MKKIFLIFFVFSFFSCAFITSSFAGKWRVNNTGISAHFTTAQQAAGSSSVQTGDTLYFESSMNSYGNMELTKRLILIGPGYFLGQNPETQANIAQAKIENLTFSLGSKGSIMTGMTVNSWTTIQDTAITMTRNNLGSTNVFNPSINNVITQNYIHSLNLSGSQGNTIANNIFVKSNACWDGNCLYMGSNSSAEIRNNIFKGCQSIQNAVYENNIATGTAANSNNTFTSTNSTIYNNIGASTQYGSSDGNQENIDMTTVFVNTVSPDGMYQLLPGSPAIGAGVGGVDCGIFSGPDPYILSGMPDLPSIWYIDIIGSEVTVKAVSN